MPRWPSLRPTATATAAAAAALHVAHRDIIVVAVTATNLRSLPHSHLLAASRYSPSPVGCRTHMAVHAIVTPLMALQRAGHGWSWMLMLVPSCLDVGSSATTAHVPPRRR